MPASARARDRSRVGRPAGARKLRASRPAPTSRTNESAVSATTRRLRRRRLPPVSPAPSEPSRRESLEVGAGGLKRRRQPEDDRRDERRDEGEERARGRRCGSRRRAAGPREARRAAPPFRRRRARGRARRRRVPSSSALRQQLAHDAPRGPRRAPCGSRPRASGRRPARAAGWRRWRTRSGTRGDRAEQNEQRRPHAGHEALGERQERGRPSPRSPSGTGARDCLRSWRARRSACATETPGFEAADDRERVAAAALAEISEDGILGDRRPELAPAGLPGGVSNDGRHHADDGEEALVETDSLSDGRGVAAEPLAPQFVSRGRRRAARPARRRTPGAPRPSSGPRAEQRRRRSTSTVPATTSAGSP